ncbi:SRPBCC domain-containing protein [Lewinella cohaerens]|uniref:SRPBCC domain-containing protein n=1 Tax=Lewinella cohaerens TaxID=70995 RepID=UPI000360A2B8|nr:SRPBCC domain-containing protein [Lewinella cohaerens]
MKSIQTEIKINATLYEVWLALTQFHAYELWNPFIVDIRGEVGLGNKLKLTLYPAMSQLNERMNENKMPDDAPNFAGQEMTSLNKSSTFKVKISHFEEEKKLSWERRSFFMGSYFHEFLLEETSNNQVIFKNNIEMSGLLVNMGWEAYIKHMYQSGLELMNEKLKEKVESDVLFIDPKLADERT